jgi:hypothetical protein
MRSWVQSPAPSKKSKLKKKSFSNRGSEFDQNTYACMETAQWNFPCPFLWYWGLNSGSVVDSRHSTTWATPPALLQWLFFCCCSFIYMCIHCVGNFSTLPPTQFPPTQLQAGPILPLSLILLKKRHTRNKEDKAFLLVKSSYTEKFLLLLSCTHVLRPMLIQL